MNSPSWYYARNQEKHVRQIVVRLSPDSRTVPLVGNVTADASFTVPKWAVTVLRDSPSAAPVIFAKATGAIEMLDNKPADVAFAFYHLQHGGVFQIFVQVDSSAVRSKFGSAFIAEYACWLDEADDRRIIEALIVSDEIELCFVAPGEKGPCTAFFGLSGIVPPDCREKLKQQWNELQKHHHSIQFRDFQSALQQYNQENPMEASPVLSPAEPETAPEAPGGLGLTDYDIVELYNHGIRKVGDIELTQGVYEMARLELEMGAKRELSDFASDLIKQKEKKKKRPQKKQRRTAAQPQKTSIQRPIVPINTSALILVPTLITLSLNLIGLFVMHWSRSTYMLVNFSLIVAVGIYSAFRLDRAGAWPPEKASTRDSSEELGGCIGGLFVIGIVLAILAGALKLSNTIMLPIVFVSLCIYALFQLAVYPRLFKALLLFTVITRLPELVGSLLLPTGNQGSPVRSSNIFGLSLATPVYATWVGMITAAVLDWQKNRRAVVAPAIDKRYPDRADDTDRTSPTHVYSLAVAKIQGAPNDLGEAELQKYYLDVCALFEQAIRLDTNRSELDKEAYKKVAYTCGALYRSLKKHEDALRLFGVGLKHHSHDPELLAGVGWSQFDLGQISEAEKTVSRLLELAPDSSDGRQLWKAIRKAQGQELTSDLSEGLKRQIYKEYLETKDRSFVEGYMNSGVSSKLSFEDLVSNISGKAAEADVKVRRLLLEKYGLKEFEFDLILKQGEREAWN